jgi:hypothetical protein
MEEINKNSENKKLNVSNIASKEAIEYAKFIHGEEYSDPTFAPDISQTIRDFKSGFIVGIKNQQLDISNVSKCDLGNYLVEIIKECKEGIRKNIEQNPNGELTSPEWVWLASKKTLAENILIKFC